MASFRVALFAALLSVLIAAAGLANAQATRDTVAPLLEQQVQSNAVTAYQIQKYLMKDITKPRALATAEQWSAEQQALRKRILKDIIYHGWPPDPHAPDSCSLKFGARSPEPGALASSEPRAVVVAVQLAEAGSRVEGQSGGVGAFDL